MHLSQLIKPEDVYIDSISQSKTALLHTISHILSCHSSVFTPINLFEIFWQREQLGSTAIGHGVAIPHVRVQAFTKPKACFLKLLQPIEFGALDKQPVDLVFALASPKNHSELHLLILQTISQQFFDVNFRKACRQTNDRQSLYSLLTSVTESVLA